MTVRLTVGAEVLVPVLLEITPFESIPTIVNVYVFAGVTPFGVVVLVPVVPPQEGSSRNAALATNTASTPNAFRGRLPPNAVPIPAKPSSGIDNHSA